MWGQLAHAKTHLTTHLFSKPPAPRRGLFSFQTHAFFRLWGADCLPPPGARQHTLPSPVSPHNPASDQRAKQKPLCCFFPMTVPLCRYNDTEEPHTHQLEPRLQKKTALHGGFTISSEKVCHVPAHGRYGPHQFSAKADRSRTCPLLTWSTRSTCRKWTTP